MLAALALLAAQARAADDAADDGAPPPITPYRPTVSDPAQLPAPGQLELELGGLRMLGDDAPRRGSTPYLLKLAFDQDWGLLLGGDAYVWMRGAPASSQGSQGVGDTTLTLKRAWILDKADALGVEFEVKLPTAGSTRGSGSTDYTVNGIYSRDFGPVHMDLNLNVTALGAADPGSSHTQWGAASAFSTALSDHWGMAGEFSGTRQQGADSGFQFLGALPYSPSKRLTFDFGFVHAMRPRPAVNSLFAGVVLPLARLW